MNARIQPGAVLEGAKMYVGRGIVDIQRGTLIFNGTACNKRDQNRKILFIISGMFIFLFLFPLWHICIHQVLNWILLKIKINGFTLAMARN